MSGSITFMTYNVWSCEHVAVYRRIKSISEIIEQHDPDVIFLQEVTHYIYSLFQEAPWWENYTKFPSKEKYQKNHSSFCLLLSKLDAGHVVLPQYSNIGSSKPMGVHEAAPPARGDVQGCRLASPAPSDVGCVHRRAQASAFLEHFDAIHRLLAPACNERSFVLDENVVLGGDLDWDDDLDGPLRLGDGWWVDAWLDLRGGEAGGWTYDAVANQMLKVLNLTAERRRPDRFSCKLRDFTLESIEMLGVEAIPDVIRFDDKGGFVPRQSFYTDLTFDAVRSLRAAFS
ncbi:uncharacterized protein [Miscanthus floridulus]|uniref:uncharacterized protein n=1 Tax=Miscanthus floridulus TaxID=154761 RepID=UPI003457E02C